MGGNERNGCLLTGSCIGLFAADDQLTSCAFVGPSSSQLLMAGSEGGAVHFVKIPPGCLPAPNA